jgi:hypothetical protein
MIRTRRNYTYAPLACTVCREEIVKGQRYWTERVGTERHEGCDPARAVPKPAHHELVPDWCHGEAKLPLTH